MATLVYLMGGLVYLAMRSAPEQLKSAMMCAFQMLSLAVVSHSYMARCLKRFVPRGITISFDGKCVVDVDSAGMSSIS